jgi:predicted Zn-dependent peptidase
LVQKTVLDNGVRILTERMEHVRSVSVGVWVGTGSRDESKETAGISHLLEHMIFKGTERRSALDIAKEIDSIGGMSNAFTSRENTCYHAKVLDNHLDQVVDLLTDIFLNSLFVPEELKREQEVVLQEIKMVEDTPDEHVHQLLPQIFWRDEPLGRPILGTVESVSSFDPDGLRSYINDNYRADRIVIAASGSLEHDRLVELIKPGFGPLNGEPGPARQPAPQAAQGDLIRERELEQVHLCLGLPGVSSVLPERFPAALLNILLGGSMSSLLFQEVREKRGLAYAVYSYMASYTDAGMSGVYLGVDPSRTREALEVVLEVMARMRQGVDEDDLSKAKEHLKGSIFLAAESTDVRMSRMAKNEFNFGRYIPYQELADNINSVTPEMVAASAEAMLNPKRMALVAMGPGIEESLADGWYRN